MLTELMALAMLEASTPCIEDREALLSLSQQDFDQDMTGGWRGVSYREGCEEAAADLIAEYRTRHGLENQFILWWHEGQVRAALGQTDEALALFKRSYQTDNPDTFLDEAWNYYADATIAFLERDFDALLAAREKLSQLPIPQNIEVVDSLIRCYDRPYSEAYSRTCGLEDKSDD